MDKVSSSDGMLERLKRQDAEAILDVDQLEPEEHDRRSRAADFGVERHWKREIKPWLNWLYFTIICIVTVSIIGLCASYLWDIHGDIKAKKDLIKNIIQLFLVSGATLFVESKLGKK